MHRWKDKNIGRRKNKELVVGQTQREEDKLRGRKTNTEAGEGGETQKKED